MRRRLLLLLTCALALPGVAVGAEVRVPAGGGALAAAVAAASPGDTLLLEGAIPAAVLALLVPGRRRDRRHGIFDFMDTPIA